MVAANQCHAVRVAHLEAEEEEKGFDRVEAAVNKVACRWSANQTWQWDQPTPGVGSDGVRRAPTHKEVVCVWRVAADAEQLHQVVELSMDVTAYLGRDQSVRTDRFGSVHEVRDQATVCIPYRNWRRDGNHIALLDEQLAGLVADLADVGFRN